MQHVLIANRGEIAVRAIRTCRKLGLESTAVYSQADANSPHAWMADHSVCIGPPPSNQSYLNIPALLHVAESKGCDALYPGYGFLAENAGFAKQCQEQDLIFIGPQPETIQQMGDKARARETATKLGIPVVPGSESAFDDVSDAKKAAQEIGFPLLVKASAGGGGRGMRVVEHLDDFTDLFTQASNEAEAAFGDGLLYLERFFPHVRHIEVQVFGDDKGNAMHFGERDCSIQRRHQKLVEESPSPALDDETRKRLHKTAVDLTRGINYIGAGTVEFIYSEETQEFYFIEMNTRIQVEHPVSEEICGYDLIELQMRVAAGESLKDIQFPDPVGGHAIEFRINAEDWRKNFTPAPGTLRRWRPPASDGVRVDTHVYETYAIPPYYDSMIGKLIIHGENREDALAQAAKALKNFECDGVTTTLDFHKSLLDDEQFRSGEFHTRWVETDFLPRML